MPPDDRRFALDGVIAGDLSIIIYVSIFNWINLPFSEYGGMLLVERVMLCRGIIIAEEWSRPTCQVHGQLLKIDQ